MSISRAIRRLSQSRYNVLVYVGIVFLSISMLVRTGLLIFDGLPTGNPLIVISKVYLVGLLYDLAALSWVMIPFIIIALFSGKGEKGRKLHAVLASFAFILGIIGLVFESLSEAVFWNEFASRFNFIAVDYLLFTREVIGNIQQSYPLSLLLSAVGVVSGLVLWKTLPAFWRAAKSEAPVFSGRLLVSALLLALPVGFFFNLNEQPHQMMQTPASRELSSNGLYSFFRAFRNNELDYREYYKTLPDKEVNKILSEEFGAPVSETEQEMSSLDQALTHHQLPIANSLADRPKNLVLVSIESLGSDYVDAFNGGRGLTPHLDELAEQGLIFTNLYATGLRTVRGLEALSLSVPPTPGRAVLMREKNKQLQTLGGVFKDAGYESLYFYGGYSIFDNMKDFFGGNHYQVVDRTDIDPSIIDHETIWGVADEDLFETTLAELDKKAGEGKKFFAHVMTTSNHRPYTYPENRVSIPPHTGRNGAVQYTDWAIGQFIDQAKTKEWFDETLFVFVADHTSHGRGRTDIPPENYQIPLIIYQPNLINAGVDNRLASQIDIAPSLLSLMGVEYDSTMFGQNLFNSHNYHARAFMASYLTLGYMESGLIAELGPMKTVRVVDAKTGAAVSDSDPRIEPLIEHAISFYQGASDYLQQHGRSDTDAPQVN